MADQLTITAKTGPGLTVTTKVYSNVSDLFFHLGGRRTLEVFTGGSAPEQTYDIDAAATVTYTISSKQATIAIS